MNMGRVVPSAWWLLLAILVTAPAIAATQKVDETFPLLKTKTATYTNVTVTSKTADYIFIFHSRGMGNVKITELPVEVRQKLGYKVDRSELPGSNAPAAHPALDLNSMARERFKGWSVPAQWNPDRIPKQTWYIALAILFGLHLFFGYCCHLICIKTTGTGSLLNWIPCLQFIPLLRAAGMHSFLWIIGAILPVIGCIVYIVWAVNIVKARGKAQWIALPLILPLTNLLAFLYLAFSSAASSEGAAPPKYKSMALQTA